MEKMTPRDAYEYAISMLVKLGAVGLKAKRSS